MTLDQLSYVLEQRYNNIKIGNDALLACTTTRSEDGRFLINNPDAVIVEWRINYLEQPTADVLDELWVKLSERYHSDPGRIDSEMYKYLNKKNDTIPPVTINDI